MDAASGGTATAVIAVAVEAGPVNQPPAISAQRGPVTLGVGQVRVLNLPAGFTDPDHYDFEDDVRQRVGIAVRRHGQAGRRADGHDHGTVGETTVTVTATDEGGASSQQIVQLAVEAGPVNQPPAISAQRGPVRCRAGPRAQPAGGVHGPRRRPLDDDARRVSASPSIATADPAAGLTVTISAGAVGASTVTVTATDESGASSRQISAVPLASWPVPPGARALAAVTTTARIRRLLRRTRASAAGAVGSRQPPSSTTLSAAPRRPDRQPRSLRARPLPEMRGVAQRGGDPSLARTRVSFSIRPRVHYDSPLLL